VRRRGALLTAATWALLWILGGSALGQTGVLVRIRQAGFDSEGRTQLVVSVTGDAANQVLGSSNFFLTEEGKPIANFEVKPLIQSKATPVSVALVMDVSGSTAGKPLADAKTAAKSFVNQLAKDVKVGLVSFSVTASLRRDFTTDRRALSQTIDSLQAAGDTALYDGLALAAGRMKGLAGLHNIVLFSDGKDTVSKVTLPQAIAAAKGVNAPVTAVVLVTKDYDPVSLGAIAAQTKGRSVSVSQSAQLAGAFQQVAKEIASQYVITYTGTALEPAELDVSVAVRVGSVVARDTAVVLNERKTVLPEGRVLAEPPKPAGPLVGAFGSNTGLYVGILGIFLGAALFFGVLLWRPIGGSGGRAMQVLQRSLKVYSRSDRRKRREREGGAISGTAIGRRAVELVERVPRTEAYQEKMQGLLDRAGWPLRATEFIILQISGVVVGAILGFGLFGAWWLGLVLVVFGAIAPRIVLAQRIDKRQTMFLAQLPDTLQLMAGSLQAGYGFMQALDTLVKESPQPTATEFSRVLTEARLGMPVDEALDGMADRVGGEDFRWVVLAINIQRQVGGNLAALLTTVASTLREREMVRRLIKTLSAEGRLSAVILTILPFALAGYIALVNPEYLHALTSETVGKFMIGGALFMVGVGILWMRKLIKIDV
jgi:tight adherence protein B